MKIAFCMQNLGCAIYRKKSLPNINYFYRYLVLSTLKCTILRVKRLYKVTRAPISDQTKDFTIFSTSAKTSSGDLVASSW